MEGWNVTNDYTPAEIEKAVADSGTFMPGKEEIKRHEGDYVLLESGVKLSVFQQKDERWAQWGMKGAGGGWFPLKTLEAKKNGITD